MRYRMEQSPLAEGEKRLVESVLMAVRAHALGLLPEDLRKQLRVKRWLEREARGAVLPRINEAIEDLAERCEAEHAKPDPLEQLRTPREPVTGRFTVMDNEAGCDLEVDGFRCGTITRAAVVVLDDGEVVGVECERCAPELRDKLLPPDLA